MRFFLPSCLHPTTKEGAPDETAPRRKRTRRGSFFRKAKELPERTHALESTTVPAEIARSSSDERQTAFSADISEHETTSQSTPDTAMETLPPVIDTQSDDSLAVHEESSTANSEVVVEVRRGAVVDPETGLKPGDCFAQKYRILPSIAPAPAPSFNAINLHTGEEVLLRFYPDGCAAVHRALRHHHLTNDGRYVRKLLDAVEAKDGVPACLVFEQGCCTLEERLSKGTPKIHDQLSTLDEILRALLSVHQRGLVLGNLHPSNIMWFATDFCWKLSSLDNAVGLGEMRPLNDVPLRYAAPEVLDAVADGATSMSMSPATDMWSFGVIAFEVLTCSCVQDVFGVREYVTRQLESVDDAAETAEDRRNLRFVLSFLSEGMELRNTAAAGLSDGFFRCATDGENPDDANERPADYVPHLGFVSRWPGWLWNHILFDHVSLTVKVECFVDPTETAPFDRRCAKETLRFYDDFLPEYPVHTFRLGHDMRLSIFIELREDMPFPVERISSVAIEAPGDEFRQLEMTSSRERDTLMATALLQPTAFHSKRLNSLSPTFGYVEEKYVKLTAQIKVLLGEGFRREVNLYRLIYCRIIHPKNKLRFQRFIRFFENQKSFYDEK